VAELDSSPDRWILSIANNHIGDDGPPGIERTQRALETAGFGVAGRRGPDRPLVVTRDLPVGRIGIACWSRWLNHRELAPDDGVWRHHDVANVDWAALRSSDDLDLLLAFPHWDREFCLAPSPETRDAARRLVAGGVDVVVGHHPHVAQPWERVDGRPVLYSIGSFHGPLPWMWRAEHRLGWMAELELARPDAGAARPVALTVHPVVLVREGRGHALVPLAAAPEADRRRMVPLADLLFPTSAHSP
jgi:poly-gamma-glutamate synthesis protein (capsule biosynthesis protein)